MVTFFGNVIWLLMDDVFGPIRWFVIIRISHLARRGVLPIVWVGTLLFGMDSLNPFFGHGTTSKLLQCEEGIQHPFLPLVGGRYRVLHNLATWYVVLFRRKACIVRDRILVAALRLLSSFAWSRCEISGRVDRDCSGSRPLDAILNVCGNLPFIAYPCQYESRWQQLTGK